MNLDTLAERLPDSIDGVLIESPENRLYFTGFHSSAGVLLIAKAGRIFLTDSRYLEAARDAVEDCEVRQVRRYEDDLPEAVAALGCKTLALESARVTVARARKFAQMLPECELFDDDTADRLINALRAVKSEDEIAHLKQAQTVAEKAFEHILTVIRPGVSERDIALELDYCMLKNGADALSFDTIVAAGANGAKPHAVPSDNTVNSGDFVTLDFGAVYKGYHSDMTRTVAVGSIGARQTLVYNTVLAAQIACLESLHPGLACKQADAAAREIIRAAGYGEFFGHGTGHGVGIEVHEQPTLSPYEEKTLEPGHVVTVEPGIYLPGAFGVRIEDTVCITANGYDNFVSVPKELLVL